MSESRPSFDLDESDTEAFTNAGEGVATRPIPYRGTIMMSMVGGDGFIHHAAVILPASYEVRYL